MPIGAVSNTYVEAVSPANQMQWLKVALWVQGVLLACFLVVAVLVSYRFTRTQKQYAHQLQMQSKELAQERALVQQQASDLRDRNHNVAMAWFGMGNASLKHGDANSAVGYFKNALDAMPDDDWSRRGQVRSLVKLGRSQEAQKATISAIEKYPTVVNYVSLALADCGLKDLSGAADALRHALTKDPQASSDNDLKQDCPKVLSEIR